MTRRIDPVHLALVTIFAMGSALFFHAKYGSDWIEVTAYVTGVVAVYLAAVEHILNWPIVIVSYAVYVQVFFQQKLFADLSLQCFYIALCLHGWYLWAPDRIDRTELPMTLARPKIWGMAILALIAGTGIYWPTVAYFKGASPFFDSILTVASIIAQVMLNRKILQNWLLWIVIDLAYIPLYLSRKLYPTAFLYFLLALLGAWGWIQWNRLMNARNLVPASPEPSTV